jgi:hypothetical protein
MLEGTDLMSAYQSLSGPAQYEDLYEPVQQKQEQPAPAMKKQQEDIGLLNKQFETDQKLQALAAELKKKKEAAATPAAASEPSYFDKLFGKKKELYKILSLSLIITLGLSLHFLIDHYLTKYLAEHEMSFERQLLLRLLYPLGVLFILWNLRVFVK